MSPEVEQLIVKWAEMQKRTDEIKEEILQKEEVLRDISISEDNITSDLLDLCGYQTETFGLKVDRDTFVVVSYSGHDDIELEIIDFENRRNDGERHP